MCFVQAFVFGPFQENTYVLWDDSLESVIIDPGCSNSLEEDKLAAFIQENKLQIKYLLNTHAHIDHVLGNAFVCQKYAVLPQLHEKERIILEQMTPRSSAMYGIPYKPSPGPEKWLQEGDVIVFGQTALKVLFTPGHAPGHVVFVCDQSRFVINGDVLFQGSIGRTDLPYCSYEDLEQSILEKMYTLPSDYKVYTGHGNPTTIGFEKEHNPFIRIPA